MGDVDNSQNHCRNKLGLAKSPSKKNLAFLQQKDTSPRYGIRPLPIKQRLLVVPRPLALVSKVKDVGPLIAEPLPERAKEAENSRQDNSVQQHEQLECLQEVEEGTVWHL